MAWLARFRVINCVSCVAEREKRNFPSQLAALMRSRNESKKKDEKKNKTNCARCRNRRYAWIFQITSRVSRLNERFIVGILGRYAAAAGPTDRLLIKAFWRAKVRRVIRRVIRNPRRFLISAAAVSGLRAEARAGKSSEIYLQLAETVRELCNFIFQRPRAYVLASGLYFAGGTCPRGAVFLALYFLLSKKK